MNNEKTFCIMGAGIQGCCAALLLSKYCNNITIIDQESDIMSKASASQEGRIHMGFLYSNDRSLRTGYKMLNDALNFANYIEYLLDEKIDWESVKSEKYLYLLATDSLISEQETDEYCQKLQERYVELISNNNLLGYLGKRPEKIYEKIDIPEYLNEKMFKAAYLTEEVGIVQKFLKSKIFQKLREKNIKIIFKEQIVDVQRSGEEFCIRTDKNTHSFDCVINCLWENKHKFDKKLDYKLVNSINIRLKCGIVSETIDSIKDYYSINVINGPYGDYGNFSNNGFMYFTWYPVSMIKMVVDDDSDELHVIKQKLDSDNEQRQVVGHEQQFAKIFKRGALLFKNPSVACNAVVAIGDNDIIYRDSYLHNRFETPIFHDKNYYSIQTGKYTSAPHNTYLFEKIIKNIER